MQMNLSEQFTSMNPIIIRQYKAHEVFLLVKRLNEYNARKLKETKQTKGGRVIRRKAGDNWF